MTANKDTYTILCATFITIYMESLKNMYPYRTLILILCKHQAIRERRVLLAYQILQKRHLVRHLSSTTEFKSNLSDFFLGCHESKNTDTWRVKRNVWWVGRVTNGCWDAVSAYTIRGYCFFLHDSNNHMIAVGWDPPHFTAWVKARNPSKNESWPHKISSRMAGTRYEWE